MVMRPRDRIDYSAMAIAVHPYISGKPFRIKYFEQVLDEILKDDNVAL